MTVHGVQAGGNGATVQIMPWKRLPTLEPKEDGKQDLGSQARRWRDVFVAGSVSFPGSGKIDTSANLRYGLTIRSEEGRRAWVGIHSRQNPAQGSAGYSASIQFVESGVYYWEIVTRFGSFGSSSSGDSIAFYYNDPSGTMGVGEKFKVMSTGEAFARGVMPFADNTYDLGNATFKWRSLYSTEVRTSDLYLNDSTWTTRFHLDLDEQVSRIVFRTPYAWQFQFNQSVLPGSNYAYNLGSETLAWNRVYAREYMVEDHVVNRLDVDSLPALLMPGVLTDWLAFYLPNTVELLDASTNTWVQDTSGAYNTLFTGIWGYGPAYQITNAYNAVRFTWTSFPYRWLKAVVMELAPRDNRVNIKIETSSDGANWTTVIYDQNIGGWPAWYVRFFDTYYSTQNKPYLRITIEINWVGAQTTVDLRRIMLYGQFDFASRYARLPYFTDVYKNMSVGGSVLPQVDNAKDLGSGTKYWRNLYLRGTVFMNNNVSIRGSTTQEYGGYGLWVQTASGRIHIGPLNTSYAHFVTDRANYYFNKSIAVDGTVWPYQNNVFDLGTVSRRWRRIYTYAISVGNEYAFPFNVYNNGFYTWTAVIRGNPDRAVGTYGVFWVGNGYNVLPVVHQIYGAYIYLDEIWLYDGTNNVNATLDMRDWGGTARSLLPNTSSAIYLGRNWTFRQFYVSLVQAGAGYNLVFEYSVGTDPNTGDTLWAPLTVTDETNNLSQSGWVYFAVPSDWAKVPLQVGGTVVSSNARYWIRIRTTTAPTTVATSWFINNSGVSADLIRVYNSARQKFRLNIYGDILTAGRIFLGWPAAGNQIQSTYYIGQYNGQLLTNMTFRPATDNAYDLGTSTLRWRDVWTSGKIVSDGYIAAQGGASITSNPPTIPTNRIGWKIGLWANSYWFGIASWTLAIRTDRWVSVFVQTNPASDGNSTQPDSNAGVTLGGPTGKEIWFGRDFRVVSGGAGVMRTNASFQPIADNTYDLGSSTLRWRALYAVNVFAGDIILEKGWRIVEGDDGLYVLRETPEGVKKYRIVLEPVN